MLYQCHQHKRIEVQYEYWPKLLELDEQRLIVIETEAQCSYSALVSWKALKGKASNWSIMKKDTAVTMNKKPTYCRIDTIYELIKHQ